MPTDSHTPQGVSDSDERNSKRARGRPRTTVAPCAFCHKRFKRREHLQRHERTRMSGERGFVICPHTLTVETDTHEKPFACGCGQRYARQ